MTRRFVRLGLMLSCGLLLACGAAPHTETGSLSAPLLDRPPLGATSVTVLPLVDARPSIGRHAEMPIRTSMFGWFLGVPGGMYAASLGDVVGPTIVGDDRTTLEFEGPGSPPEVLERWVRALVRATVGPGLQLSTERVSLSDVDDAADEVRGDGWAVLPVLDQLDTFQLSAEHTSDLFGAGSQVTDKGTEYSGGRTYRVQEVRSAAATISGGSREETPWIANLRLRLVLLKVAGGRVRERRVLYSATSSFRMADTPGLAARILASKLSAALASSNPAGPR